MTSTTRIANNGHPMADDYTNGLDRRMGETLRPFAKIWFEVIRNMF